MGNWPETFLKMKRGNTYFIINEQGEKINSGADEIGDLTEVDKKLFFWGCENENYFFYNDVGKKILSVDNIYRINKKTKK